MIIYYRSHPLQEPKKSIESMEVIVPIIVSKLGYFTYLEDEINHGHPSRCLENQYSPNAGEFNADESHGIESEKKITN